MAHAAKWPIHREITNAIRISKGLFAVSPVGRPNSTMSFFSKEKTHFFSKIKFRLDSIWVKIFGRLTC